MPRVTSARTTQETGPFALGLPHDRATDTNDGAYLASSHDNRALRRRFFDPLEEAVAGGARMQRPAQSPCSAPQS